MTLVCSLRAAPLGRADTVAFGAGNRGVLRQTKRERPRRTRVAFWPAS
jgi:hypothetical protein